MCPYAFFWRESFRAGDIFIHQFTDTWHQKRIPGGIIIDQFGKRTGVHSCFVILFIFLEHSFDILYRETHINQKIRSNVPGTVHLMPTVFCKFQFQIFYIINAWKYHRLECRYLIPFYIAVPQLGKKVQEYLIVGGTVCFVNDKYDRQMRSLANAAQCFE